MTVDATTAAGINLRLTDEQRNVHETVRRFVDERVLPHAVENDVEHRLDRSVIDGMAEIGLLGIVIPPEYGGARNVLAIEPPAPGETERGRAASRTATTVPDALTSL